MRTFFTRAGLGSSVGAGRSKVAGEVRAFERLPALTDTGTTAFLFFLRSFFSFAGGSMEDVEGLG